MINEPIMAQADSIPPLTSEQLDDLRQQVLSGKRLTPELSRQVVASLRVKRAAQAAASKAKGTSKSKSRTMSDAELNADLDLFLGRKTPTAGSADGADNDGEVTL